MGSMMTAMNASMNQTQALGPAVRPMIEGRARAVNGYVTEASWSVKGQSTRRRSAVTDAMTTAMEESMKPWSMRAARARQAPQACAQLAQRPASMARYNAPLPKPPEQKAVMVSTMTATEPATREIPAVTISVQFPVSLENAA